MLEVVVFSKDRACQLEFLLRSIKHYFDGWEDVAISVLYTFSGPTYRVSYEAVKRLHPEFRYLCERDLQCGFKDATLRLFGEREYVMFVVDDDVFKNPFQLDTAEFATFAADESIACLSLRMCPRMDYSYMTDEHVATPRFTDGTTWDWTLSNGDWGYPMSLDGHLFRSKDLKPMLESLDFTKPNDLEYELSLRPLPAPRAICFADSKIINLPVNRVQELAPNRHGSVDAYWLNAEFLRRRRVSLATVANVDNPSPHYELPLKWEAWEDVAVPIPTWAPVAARVAASAAVVSGGQILRRIKRRMLR